MSQSVIDCCNDALAMVGASSIINLTDNTKSARVCSVFYDCNRRALLRRHRWNFAIKRVQLAPDAAAPAFGKAYQFTLPNDCLKVILPRKDNLDWVVEGRKILSDCNDNGADDGDGNWLLAGNLAAQQSTGVANTAPVLNLRYIADIEDCTQWDSVFYDLLSDAIAIDICEPLTNSTSKKASLERHYQEAVEDAEQFDSFEKISQEPPSDSFWLVRN